MTFGGPSGSPQLDRSELFPPRLVTPPPPARSAPDQCAGLLCALRVLCNKLVSRDKFNPILSLDTNKDNSQLANAPPQSNPIPIQFQSNPSWSATIFSSGQPPILRLNGQEENRPGTICDHFFFGVALGYYDKTTTKKFGPGPFATIFSSGPL